MKLSRTDLVPLLAIVAGGVVGASLSFSFLGQSPADDVPSPDAVVVSSVTPELAVRVEFSDGAVVTGASRALTVGTLRRTINIRAASPSVDTGDEPTNYKSYWRVRPSR